MPFATNTISTLMFGSFSMKMVVFTDKKEQGWIRSGWLTKNY